MLIHFAEFTIAPIMPRLGSFHTVWGKEGLATVYKRDSFDADHRFKGDSQTFPDVSRRRGTTHAKNACQKASGETSPRCFAVCH